MLSVDAALARLLAGSSPLPVEDVGLSQAYGRYLACDITAMLTQPPFAAAAMDGYAIRWADRDAAWRVVGEAAAGRGFDGTVGSGKTVRIFTGAPLPDGTDTVAVQEEVSRDGDTARLNGAGPPHRGANIRPEGLDFTSGTLLAAAGSRVTSARLGLFAAAGHAALPVHRHPKVVLFATGDELVAPGNVPSRSQIVSANGVMLAALFRSTGAHVTDAGIVPDRSEALANAVIAANDADILVTIGGASVGDHDLVEPVLRALGVAVDFWKVAMRPGKPMLSARLGSQRIIALPGNPVSAFVTATLFVLPLLRRLAGAAQVEAVLRSGRLGVPLAANGERRDHLRASAVATPQGMRLMPSAIQDSAMLGVLAAANALIVREPYAAPADRGDAVQFIALDSAQDVA